MAQRRNQTANEETTTGKGSSSGVSQSSAAKGSPAAPMDPSAAESPSSPGFQMSEREAYALVTLTEEITALYEDATVEYGDRNGWGVALSATYTLPEEKAAALATLLRFEERVAHTMTNSATSFTVTVVPVPHLLDSRDPFDLASASAVLDEDDK